jgi:hypothetical protein
VKIVDVDFGGHGAATGFVGRAEGEAALDPAAGHPTAKAFRLVLATVPPNPLAGLALPMCFYTRCNWPLTHRIPG